MQGATQCTGHKNDAARLNSNPKSAGPRPSLHARVEHAAVGALMHRGTRGHEVKHVVSASLLVVNWSCLSSSTNQSSTLNVIIFTKWCRQGPLPTGIKSSTAPLAEWVPQSWAEPPCCKSSVPAAQKQPANSMRRPVRTYWTLSPPKSLHGGGWPVEPLPVALEGEDQGRCRARAALQGEPL